MRHVHAGRERHFHLNISLVVSPTFILKVKKEWKERNAKMCFSK